VTTLCITITSQERNNIANEPDNNRQQGTNLGGAIAISTGLGTALGVALNDMAIGIALGAAIALVFGLVVFRRKEPSQ